MNRQAHQFLRSIILFGFFLFLTKLILSGDIQKFIAPRMMPYVYFALIVIGILAVVQYLKSSSKSEDLNCGCDHSHDYSTSKLRSFIVYLLFIVPILTGMMFSDHIIGSSAASNKGFKYEMRSDSTEPDTIGISSSEDSISDVAIDDSAILTPQKRYPDLYNELQQTDQIHLNNTNYIGAITLMEDNMEGYVGKEIITHGFVFREDSTPANQFVVGRFGISCCVADGGVYGILVQGENLEQFKNDTWVEIKGTLQKAEYNGWELPLIEPLEIKPIELPDEPYVYEDLEFAG
ncbi:TIGR03943 family putative permease subunit [Halobacillus sp. B29]|uniref:TIGR03943 family putative permease subunit n=1 Tax=Halobacillus sp. B29 TaxID=3457432 RepID=UPI003FCEDB9A